MPERAFSLSRATDKVLPRVITDGDGQCREIDPDFRTVLRCLRVLTDPDISDRDKLYLIMRWFFKGAFVADAIALFLSFTRSEGGEESTDEPMMDFEYDWLYKLRAVI